MDFFYLADLEIWINDGFIQLGFTPTFVSISKGLPPVVAYWVHIAEEARRKVLERIKEQ